MTFEIMTDTEYKYFDIVCRNKKCLDCPVGFSPNRFGTGYFHAMRNGNWYKQLEAIASWVNNELNEECMFTIG